MHGVYICIHNTLAQLFSYSYIVRSAWFLLIFNTFTYLFILINGSFLVRYFWLNTFSIKNTKCATIHNVVQLLLLYIFLYFDLYCSTSVCSLNVLLSLFSIVVCQTVFFFFCFPPPVTTAVCFQCSTIKLRYYNISTPVIVILMVFVGGTSCFVFYIYCVVIFIMQLNKFVFLYSFFFCFLFCIAKTNNLE